MFGARVGATIDRKVLFLIGVQRERLAGKVQPGEARFGLELDGGKAWRLPGARREGTSRVLRVRSVGSVGRLGRGSLSGGKRVGACVIGGPVAAAEITAKPKWAVKTGPGATSGTAAKALSVRCIEA